MTNPLTHDPFYKRVKDALIIIFALYTLFPSVKDKLFGAEKPEAETASTLVLKASVDDIKARLSRLEDKIDRMAFYQRRNDR